MNANNFQYPNGQTSESLKQKMRSIPMATFTPADAGFSEPLGDEAAPAPSKYKLLSGADILALPPTKWLVRGIMSAHGLGAIYGPSGAGKSFIALDLACALAEGREWFGHHVTQTPVVYLVLEGEGGIRLRVDAWTRHHGRDIPDGLSFVLQPFELLKGADMSHMAEVIPKGATIFIDTMNRATVGMDENAPKDMSLIINASNELRRLTGGSVILIHHTGKNIGAGMRGHSSLFAAMDGVIEVCKEDNGSRLWSVAKSKDGADGGRHSFDLHLVHLPPDDEGFPQTSCVPVAVEATAQAANRDAGKRAADELMKKQLRYDLLNEIRDAQGIGVPLSRSDAHAKVGGRKQTSVEVLALLEHEGWVHEIDVPSKARKNNRRSSFLIALTTDQHDEWLKTKTIAPELREVPQSWRKVETATDSVCSRDFPEDAINSKRNESAIVTDFVCSHSVCSPKEKTNGNEREQSENCSPFFSQLPDVGTNGNKREQTGTNEKITPNCGQSDTQEVSIAIDVPQTEERIAQTDTAPDVPDVSSSGAKKAKKVGKKSAIKKVADDVALGDSPLSEKNQSTDTPAVPDAVAMDAPPAVERTGTQQADGLTDAPPAYVPSKHRHTTNEWFDLAMNAVGSDGVLTRKAWTAWIKTQFPPEKAGSARATLSNAEKALVAKGLIVRDGDSFRRA